MSRPTRSDDSRRILNDDGHAARGGDGVVPAAKGSGDRLRPPPAPLWRRLLGRRIFVISFVVLAVFLVIGMFPEWFAPSDPFDQDLTGRLLGSSSEHWLGTDQLGRDTVSRIIFAIGTSLRASALAVVFSAAIGVPLGLIAGLAPHGLGVAVDRLTDATLAIPPLVLALALGAALGRNLTTGMIAVGLVFSISLSRLVRVTTKSVLARQFVDATVIAGHGTSRIVTGHVVPHVSRPLIIQLALIAAAGIEIEAVLSFLGLGAEPNKEVSVGGMIQSSIPYLRSDPQLIFIPGVVAFAMILAWTFLADNLRDALAESDR